jgi:hypothetical protein
MSAKSRIIEAVAMDGPLKRRCNQCLGTLNLPGTIIVMTLRNNSRGERLKYTHLSCNNDFQKRYVVDLTKDD